MVHVKVTVVHQPDAGQHSSRSFTYEEHLGHRDTTTASVFAYQALAEGPFQKGLITVNFPDVATRSFRFERAGLVGYTLIQTQEQPREAEIV